MEAKKEPLRVLLVDDSPLFRKGLSGILSTCPDIQVVGEAGDGYEALEKAQETMPDIILMDIIMPRCNGLEAIQMIKEEMPYVKVIMLTVSESEEDLFQAIKLGAQGYLLKNVEAEELLQAVLGLSSGEAHVSPTIAAKILGEFARPRPGAAHPASSAQLSPREKEVLGLVVQGLTNKEISHSLDIAESTVKNHLRNIMEKLHVRNRVEAAIRFLHRESPR